MEVAVDYQQFPEVDTDIEAAMEGGLKTRTRNQYSSDVFSSVTKVDNGHEQPSKSSTYFDIQEAVEDLDFNKIVIAVQNNITSKEETKGKSKRLGIVEEEAVELEFENVVPKLNTHTMHCPNCYHQITKVVLRRKIIISPREPEVPIEKEEEPRDLLGCFSCFSLFTSSDDGGITLFPMFWNKPSANAVSKPDNGPVPEPRRQGSTSFEILKSIVYGGLMEVIASLSIVASAAAGDATTLNIIALALANLVGGVLVIGHNLWDLRDDCYKYSGQQTDNEEPRNKYKELLGSVDHFPLHVFFAVLSFLVFGIIPPLAYGYSFHETNNRDLTMVVVAAASFVCVGLLAIFKAYIDRCTGFGAYLKTITYYLTTAVAVSGVSYAVGNLVTRLIEELGLFETSSGVAMPLLPKVVSTNPSLAIY